VDTDTEEHGSVTVSSGVARAGIRDFGVAPALATYASNVVLAVLQLGNVVIMSRTLGPAGRGDVAFLTTVGGLTAQLALFGVHRAVANMVPRDPEAGPSLATISVLASLVLGCVAIAAVRALIALVPAAGAHQPSGRLWLVLGSIPIILLQNCLAQLTRGLDDHGWANVAWVAIPIVTVTGNGLLALAGALTPTAAVGMWVGGQILSTSILSAVVISRHRGFGRPRAALAREMIGFGIKTHPAQVMLVSNYRLDQWIVGALKGSHALGIYSVAVAWSESLFFLPTALQAVVRPDLVRGSPEQAAWRASRVCRVTLVLTAALTAAMWLAAPVLCVDVFGHAFAGAITQLRILTLGSFGIVALKLLGDALTAQRRPLLEMSSISAAFASIVVLDLLLIPSHGGLGAAIASAIAYSAGGIAVVLIFTRALPARTRDLVPRPADLNWMVNRVRARLAQ
jgi:O-antigen/teichoic acid export membrane protein